MVQPFYKKIKPGRPCTCMKGREKENHELESRKKKRSLYTVRTWPETRKDVRTLSKVRFCVSDFVSNRVGLLPAEQQQRPPLPGRGRGGGGGMGPGGDHVLQVRRKEYISERSKIGSRNEKKKNFQ